MTKYDKELQTGTDEYEEATKPLRKQDSDAAEDEKDEAKTPPADDRDA